MANKIKSAAQLAREKKHYGWRNAKPRVQEPRPPTSATRQQPAKVKKTTPCTSPAATKKNETSSETELQPLLETSTPPSPATPKRQAPPAQPSSGCSTPTSTSSNTSMSSEDFQTLESLREGPIAMAEELQQQLQDQEPLLPEADSLMRAGEVTQTTKAVDSPAERTKPLELDTSSESTHAPPGSEPIISSDSTQAEHASEPVISSDSTDVPPASEPVISSDSTQAPPISQPVISSDSTHTLPESKPVISSNALNTPRKSSEAEDSKAAAVDSATVEHSSLVSIALLPLSCLQWCSPALARPAVDMTVGAVVHIFAAVAALSVLGC